MFLRGPNSRIGNFRNFSVSQILREFNFEGSSSSKIAVLGGSEVWCFGIFQPLTELPHMGQKLGEKLK